MNKCPEGGAPLSTSITSLETPNDPRGSPHLIDFPVCHDGDMTNYQVKLFWPSFCVLKK